MVYKFKKFKIFILMIVLIMLNYWLQSSGFLFVVVISYYFSNCLFTIFE